MDEHSPEWLYERIRDLMVRVSNLENVQGFLAKRQEIQEDKIRVLIKE